MTASLPQKLCFVVGPIGDEGTDIRQHADWLLHGIIKPVMNAFPGFQVKRADHDPRPGLIDVQMINDLLDADLVIADLSLSNPNAFYEIGIRHMTEKPIIHMQLATESTPFDVTLYRAIKFLRARFQDIEKAKIDLTNFVEAVLVPDYQPENPVTNARGRLKLKQTATPEMRVMMEEMDRLKSEMNGMKERLAERTMSEQNAAMRLAYELSRTPGLGMVPAARGESVDLGIVRSVASGNALSDLSAPLSSNALSGNALSGMSTTAHPDSSGVGFGNALSNIGKAFADKS